MKPILFNTEMVKAILDGRKTQTRRIVLKDFMEIEIDKDVMPQKVEFINFKRYCPSLNFKDDGNAVFRLVNRDIKPLPFCDGICREIDVRPRYKVGDVLYVRETFLIGEYGDCYNGEGTDDSTIIEQYSTSKDVIYYADAIDIVDYDSLYGADKPIWKPSIHMPKEYARIFLKVTNVRVERLQDITFDDIEKYGIKFNLKINGKNKFKILWNSTAKDGYKWEDNPYVFIYEFERIHDV